MAAVSAYCGCGRAGFAQSVARGAQGDFVSSPIGEPGPLLRVAGCGGIEGARLRCAVGFVGLRCGHRPDGRGRARLGWTSCPTRLARPSMAAGHPLPPGRRRALYFSSFVRGALGGWEEKSGSLSLSATDQFRLREGLSCRSGFSRDCWIPRSRLKPLLQRASDMTSGGEPPLLRGCGDSRGDRQGRSGAGPRSGHATITRSRRVAVHSAPGSAG